MYGLIPMRGVGVELNVIAGSFETAGGNPTVVNGHGFTVTRSGAGVYVVAFSQPYPAAVIAVTATCGAKTEATEMHCEVDGDTLTTAGFTIRLSGVASNNPVDDNGSLVSFAAFVSDSYLDV